MFCPHCDGEIYKARIAHLNLEVYLCDVCESLWEIKDIRSIIKPSLKSIEPFLNQHGLEYMSTEIEELGYDWDKSELKNIGLILCPFCEGKGIVYRIKIGALDNMLVYNCDNCNALWHEGQKIDKNTKETLLGFLQTKGLDYLTARLSDFTPDWSKEKKEN